MQTTKPVDAFSDFFFGEGRDVRTLVFECCSLDVLASFSQASWSCRAVVQEYLKQRLYFFLSPFIAYEYIEEFVAVLTASNSAVVGSTALKILLNGGGSSWAPRDLNIATPRDGLQNFLQLFHGLQFRFAGAGVLKREAAAAFTHSVFVNPEGKTITVTEAHESDSFLGVVVRAGHTACMNFISSEHFGCLYPTQTLQNRISYAFGIPPASTTYFEMLSKGFAIFLESAYHPVKHPTCCPTAQREFAGFAGVGLLEWRRGNVMSNLLTRRYNWCLGRFTFNGHAASVDVRSTTRSFISASALSRFGLDPERCFHDIAVSVRIGETWMTCIVSMISTTHFANFDVILGTDWKVFLKELCGVMSFTVPRVFFMLCVSSLPDGLQVENLCSFDSGSTSHDFHASESVDVDVNMSNSHLLNSEIESVHLASVLCSTLLCPTYSCQTPVIPADSGGMEPDSGGIRRNGTGIQWNPAESCGIQWIPVE
ncbi:uncharacterized protein LACBIDRAFT_324472 [Laccaria bicolor S238N-H82]|uniref:Predicted protein n=1 Tax=Laccaria bicolor (strain S238N-H82 / ATCC MYA-4686) TaxID=486041 RepID=B0D1X7_LACBS|nr:uncharacterized protein LACBIDRAFT_324472 [Laccaria bicolor S238N-H82]EDR11719.1 predicted protein [Laccaria bicolor S238N-H82]|eukprot:XP_001877616.1 predicted protein [Laccaria bicolor S238N-H82]